MSFLPQIYQNAEMVEMAQNQNEFQKRHNVVFDEQVEKTGFSRISEMTHDKL